MANDYVCPRCDGYKSVGIVGSRGRAVCPSCKGTGVDKLAKARESVIRAAKAHLKRYKIGQDLQIKTAVERLRKLEGK